MDLSNSNLQSSETNLDSYMLIDYNHQLLLYYKVVIKVIFADVTVKLALICNACYGLLHDDTKIELNSL